MYSIVINVFVQVACFSIHAHICIHSFVHRVRLTYFKEYEFFIFSYLNILTALFLYVHVILRVVEVPSQWEMASIAYISYALRGFRFVLTVR